MEATRIVRETGGAVPPCSQCAGTGQTWDVCHVCSGEGNMWVWGKEETTCIECHGSGLQPCWSCGGTGTVPVRVRNMTPHPVTIRTLTPAEEVVIPPDPAGPARCTPQTEVVGRATIIVNDRAVTVPIRRTVMGEVTGLPDPEPGVLLIVSRVVAEAARDRRDLVIVDDTVRDDQGRIVGARALAVVP